ncbi:MAG: zinc ribbon domain-containing protein [Terriglobales bacterium]
MAFCTSCGANVDVTATTCPKCGAALAGAAAASSAAPAAGTPPAKKGSSAVKIILMVLGAFFLLGALVVGGLIYGAYRIADSVKVKNEGGEARVETPFGTVEANKDPKEIAKDLDVEIYPGATPLKEGNSSVTFGGMKVATAMFETSDRSQKVYEFYKEEFPKANMATSDGDKHTIMAGDRNDFVTIVIEEQGGKTRITIARTSK